MGYIEIKTPIWDKRKVGIAEFRFSGGFCNVKILYKDKDGNLLHPGLFKISREKAMSYPTQIVKGVTLRIVPIQDLDPA